MLEIGPSDRVGFDHAVDWWALAWRIESGLPDRSSPRGDEPAERDDSTWISGGLNAQ
jgi:hypothetical protein